MSDLLRQSKGDPAPPPPPRPRPAPIGTAIPEQDERPSSDSSSSSASSAASITTIRPTSGTQHPLPPSHWSHYFTRELHLQHSDPTAQTTATYHAYLTPPANTTKGPLFICHHGAGASAMSFALLATHLRAHLPHAGILSLSARGHGSTVTSTSPTPTTPTPETDYALPTLVTDATHTIRLAATHESWPTLPPTILLGHSLGAAVLTTLAQTPTPPRHQLFGANLVGNAVFDVVEGSALEALGFMQAYLGSRPEGFGSEAEAVEWHLRSRTLRGREAAGVSVPSLLRWEEGGVGEGGDGVEGGEGRAKGKGPGRYVWNTALEPTQLHWPTWFGSLSSKFLSTPCAKLLVLAGTDRLDKELMIGQMQGKFQLVVVPEAGHFVHEDAVERVAGVVAEFWGRNERGGLVLPMKVGEMLERGMKV